MELVGRDSERKDASRSGVSSSISPLREGLVFFSPPLAEGTLLRDIFLFLIFFYRDDRLESE